MIDTAKALGALNLLSGTGMLTPAIAKMLQKTVDNKLSYADFVIIDLGAEVGMLFLQEDFLQNLERTKRRHEYDKLSVPEVFVIENAEEWHKPQFSLLAEKRYVQEAAEPWHPSLRKKFAPDPVVSAWFNRHAKYIDLGIRVCATLYQGKSMNEADLEKLQSGGTL